MKPNWLTGAATAVLAGLTLVLAVIAVFQDWIRALVWHPRLAVETTGMPPDCHMLKVVQGSPKGNEMVDCCYLRIRVRNAGHVTAQQVEVYIAEIQERQPDGGYKRLEDRPSVGLVWSYGEPRSSTLASLHPGIQLYCDLGHIIKPQQKWPRPWDPNKTELELDVKWQSTSLNYFLPPGQYRLLMQVAAANMKPVKRTLELTLTGEWHSDEKKMLDEGVRLHFA